MKERIIRNKLSLERHFFDSGRMRLAIGYLAAAVGLSCFAYIARVTLAIPVFLLCLVIYVQFLHRKMKHPYHLLNIAFLYVIAIAVSYSILTNAVSMVYIPFSIVPMLSALLFSDLIVTFFLTAACAVTVAYFTPDPRYIVLLFLTSGMLSSLLVFGARRRQTIINSGIIVGVVQALVFFFLTHGRLRELDRYLILFINGIASGVIVLGVLPIFEYLFGTITNIKLLELADFNNPVLNRLMLEAPGTYHHSLIVGNLAEAACKAVEANALLARIGAYYHDIGKLGKPEYFTENQGLTGNVHEALAPNMSKIVIMNHVDEGVELARRNKLSPRLIDFIQQHHGSSLVYFFYRRALENSETQEEITEEGFRYPGPKPGTKETAVVLLADSVEAATRTLKDPTAPQIEETVHKIINNKFIDGQLDECDLTLKDLEIIATVFSRILGGMYHSRINYPEEASENNHKKSSKEDSHRSANDPHNHS